MKKLILYDLDGTLVDTRRDIINGVRYALKTLKGPKLTDDEIKDCVGTGLWTVAVNNASLPVTFKVLVNDLTWSTGNDYVVEAGQSVTIVPTF